MRLMTYNVHRFVGTDRRCDPMRIADVIAGEAPDVVALQEVQIGRARFGGLDAGEALARRLGMDFFFQPTAEVFGERFGLAILTGFPARLVRGGPLPRGGRGPAIERRCALQISVDCDGRPVRIVGTHLAVLSRRDRLMQAQALLGPDWLGADDGPAILLGDLNAGCDSPAHRLLAESLSCSRRAAPERQPTFPAWLPLTSIDHIFAAGALRIDAARAVRTPFARRASDHLPFVADVALEWSDVTLSAREAA